MPGIIIKEDEGGLGTPENPLGVDSYNIVQLLSGIYKELKKMNFCLSSMSGIELSDSDIEGDV